MTISGGIETQDNEVELSIAISGGRSYKKIYNDVVSSAISKFSLISTTLNKILLSKTTKHDIHFYIDQVKVLLQRSHVQMIHGDLPFQNKYNMWLLDGYIRMLLETLDMKLIVELLDIDSILYSIEEAKIKDNQYEEIHFDLPKNLKVISLKQIDKKYEISTPVTDELSAYIHSLDNNLALLTKFIETNKEAFCEIYKNIIATALKYLQ